MRRYRRLHRRWLWRCNAARPPDGLCELGPGTRLLHLGSQAFADRGRAGARGTRHRCPGVPLGEKTRRPVRAQTFRAASAARGRTGKRRPARARPVCSIWPATSQSGWRIGWTRNTTVFIRCRRILKAPRPGISACTAEARSTILPDESTTLCMSRAARARRLARGCRRSASAARAPALFDCSSVTAEPPSLRSAWTDRRVARKRWGAS